MSKKKKGILNVYSCYNAVVSYYTQYILQIQRDGVYKADKICNNYINFIENMREQASLSRVYNNPEALREIRKAVVEKLLWVRACKRENVFYTN